MSNTAGPSDVTGQILWTLFGDESYCEHGTTAWEGACQSCINPTTEYGKVIYISDRKLREL